MRVFLIASAATALIAASGAEAGQRVVAHGPGVMPMQGGAMQGGAMQGGAMQGGAMRGGMAMHGGQMGPMNGGQAWHGGGATPPPQVHMGGNRWGSKVGGHWWGGVNAPGGWNAYRRPARGYVVPSYWVSPRFYITDWSGYGLAQPGAGYNWVRYYDDAVLIDGRGSVYDVADGVDWDRYDNGYYTDDTQVYAGPSDRGGYADGGYPQADYPQGNYDTRAYRQRRGGSDGVAGAVIGGVVGGVAGNAIAGRGNRLGGTLIGAGVGAAAGYAVDRAASAPRRDRYAPPPAYGADYGNAGGYDTRGYREPPIAPSAPPPPPRGYAPPPPPRDYAPYPPRGGPVVTSNGGTTVTTTTTGGYAAGGYYYPAGSTTTVVVQQAPVVTTTTTEVYEDSVTYVKRKPAPRKIYKRVWRPAPRCGCR